MCDIMMNDECYGKTIVILSIKVNLMFPCRYRDCFWEQLWEFILITAIH